MHEIRGLAASAGVAVGPWVRVEAAPAVVGRRIDPGEADGERARLAEGAAAAAADLRILAERVAGEGHEDEAAIFEAQAAIATDPALAALSDERIAAGDDAVAAVQHAAAAFAEQLRGLGDELLAARAADVLDVGGRIARSLAGVEVAPARLDRPSVVVADDLPPSVTATLPRGQLLGLALEGSSPTAHAAILARAYGIPAVVQARGLLEAVGPASGADEAGDRLLALDGETGDIVVDPDAAARASFERRAERARERRAGDVREAALPSTTADGTEVTLFANIGTPEEADPAIALGAHGVGLFRTEFLFLERATAPTEEEQVAAYRRVVEAFAPHPVTIRLLDVGGDKQIPYLPIAREDNPFLGVRALRLARTEPRLFVTQLRACYRAAAAGPVKVMAPMVADASDAGLLLDLARRARDELAAEGLPAGEAALGVMLEIPSAVLVGRSYFDRLAFASLGTNDLLQYALAVDRGNAALEAYRDTLHPALLRLVREAVEAAADAGIDLSVCGEMAGEPAAALALVGLGIRQLSMAASSLPGVRRAIRASRLPELESAATAALDDASATEVRGRFAAFLAEPAPAA